MTIAGTTYFVDATREVVKTISEKCQGLSHGYLCRCWKECWTFRVKNFAVAQKIANDSVFAHTPLLHEMNCVFEQLQTISVDPNMVGGERGKTLFDFVDAKTVRSLQQDALEQTKEVEDLLAAHEHAITRIAAIYDFFRMFDKAHGSDVDALVGEERDINLVTNEVQPIEKLYDAAVSFFVDMEQCDRFLLQYFTTINDINPDYEFIFADAQLVFDELRSLRDFYRQFLASYESVVTELLRRKQYDSKVRQFIEQTIAELATFAQEEASMRSAFCEEHARFLPSTLCPVIQNLPDKFVIVRESNEDDFVASEKAK